MRMAVLKESMFLKEKLLPRVILAFTDNKDFYLVASSLGLVSIAPTLPTGKIFPFHCLSSVQFSSVAQSCLTHCDPMNCSTPGLPVHHQLPELAQTHVHLVGDTIQPSHPLSSPSPPAFNLSLHQGLFQGVSSSHQVAKLLEFQLQHQSFQ